jgi:hypothetical protein
VREDYNKFRIGDIHSSGMSIASPKCYYAVKSVMLCKQQGKRKNVFVSEFQHVCLPQNLSMCDQWCHTLTLLSIGYLGCVESVCSVNIIIWEIKTIDVNLNSALGHLHHVDVGSFADVPEVHATSMFTYSDFEDGGSTYLQNIGNTAPYPHSVHTQELCQTQWLTIVKA